MSITLIPFLFEIRYCSSQSFLEDNKLGKFLSSSPSVTGQQELECQGRKGI